ncbi:hypothetical protein CASFOL_027485 [Castilleja foliolosa]|uniref:Thaumatin-like protein n=1 Tax=Castilleja foliolosa TaxID=1961234 RepID=A0ABD3CFX7_9LAMI
MGIHISPSIIVVLCIFFASHVEAAVFTIRNNCPYQIWPATLTGTGSPALTGFELAPQASNTLDIPSPWSGRFWARTQCSSASGRFTCLSGECNSGQVECNGNGATPPASLAEFTLAGSDGQDFYDVSLVDGFNLPVSIVPDNANCPSTSCPADINPGCPSQLAVTDANGGIIGCRSACAALNEPQYCCTGDFSTPETCPPTEYSQIFKNQCPEAYSYAYDDETSTFTCPTGANYLITFCP